MDGQVDGGLVRRVTKASGVPVDVVASLDDLYFQGKLASPDNFEPAVTVAQLTLPPNGIAFDLGACLGIVSSAIAQFVPAGRVFAVEASTALQPGLLRTSEATTHSNITTVNAAIGSTVGAARYHANPQGGAWGYVDDAGGYEVDQTTVDQLMSEHGLQRLDLIKIDIEGSELAALQGAEASIAAYCPVLVIELNPYCLWRFGRTLPQDLFSWIRDRYEFVWTIDDQANVKRVETDNDAEGVLNTLGALGGLIDVVASPTLIDFPMPLWHPPVTEVTAAPKVANSSFRIVLRRARSLARRWRAKIRRR